jgi:hypothetical protein
LIITSIAPDPLQYLGPFLYEEVSYTMKNIVLYHHQTTIMIRKLNIITCMQMLNKIQVLGLSEHHKNKKTNDMT